MDQPKKQAFSGYLEVLDHDGRPVGEVALQEETTVGRGSAEAKVDIQVPAECLSCSRIHARIRTQNGQAIMQDVSTYGTRVNGVVVGQGSLLLHDGDEIVFGVPADGWRVRFWAARAGAVTRRQDPLESLTVRESPRQIRIGHEVIDEQLGNQPFRLLLFLTEHKGNWYPVRYLIDMLYSDPDHSPEQADQALSRAKKRVNDLLGPFLQGEDAIESFPIRGYRLKARLDDPSRRR